MKYLKPIQILIVSVSILIAGAAIAAPKAPETTIIDNIDIVIPNPPTYYPKNFQRTGVLRERQQNRALEISGLKYYYGINIKVHSISSQFSSISNIVIGANLGFSFVADTNGQLFLTEVWIIPNSATFRNDLDQ